jgi:SNF2 family DNA or RNA helicase
MGDSIHFFSSSAKFLMELCARQRFVPGLSTRQENGAAVYEARWLPLLLEESEARRFDVLCAAMPPACRALPEDAGVARPREITADFMASGLDALIRSWISPEPLSRQRLLQKKEQKEEENGSLAQRWLRSLLSYDPKVTLPPARTEWFRHKLSEWLSQVLVPPGRVSFRTAFRLEPPQSEPDLDLWGSAPSPDLGKGWKLTYLLQAIDDRNVLIPLEQVWKETAKTLEFQGRRYENPQERLLADLGKASRLFPIIEGSLYTACPDHLSMTTREAYSFLTETQFLLEEGGFGVLLPDFWQEENTRGLNLRVFLATPKAQKDRAFARGLDTPITFSWELTLGGKAITTEELQRLTLVKTPLAKVAGLWVEIRQDLIHNALNFVRQYPGEQEISLRRAIAMGLGIDLRERGLPLGEIVVEGALKDLMNALRQGETLEPVSPPRSFVGELRPYQVRGLTWMSFLEKWGIGACLADDMGLGKTIQFLALMLRRKEEERISGPTLLICPTSVAGNWLREAQRFSPSLKIHLHHGAERLSGPRFVSMASEHDLVISTYSLVYRDMEHLRHVVWDGVVLDEAQNIKNPATKQAKAVRDLHAGYRVALTGTPVENRLEELWSIMDFLNPGYLGGLNQFQRNYSIPIERYRDPEVTRQLKGIVGPFMLRRVKTDPRVISDLPEKIETKVYCQLSAEQADLYRRIVKDMLMNIKGSAGIMRKGLILGTLTKLKQICDHPELYLKDGSPLEGRSGKLQRLIEMLEEVIEAGDRALIFSQFVQMGERLKRSIQETFGEEVLFLHGGTPREVREKMIRRFQEEKAGPKLFILSLKAGGYGVNLTRATHVFHFDRWWNPAVENQATDRTHRIGQENTVQVHKFIANATLEERIDLLIESKKALARNIVGTGEMWLTELSDDQLKDLISLGVDRTAEYAGVRRESRQSAVER